MMEAAAAGDADRKVAPVARDAAEPLVGTIGLRLRAMLLDGTLRAGAKLNEAALANSLAVSRTALREAVRGLEPSGLVTVIPNRGVFVREVGLQDMMDLFDVHAGLAHAAGRLLASRIGAAQVEQLAACQAAMRAAVAAGDVPRYRDLNAAFHRDLFGFAANARLTTLHEQIVSELQLSRRHNLASLYQLRASVTEHARILEGVRQRDAARTARAFAEHVLAGKRRMLEAVASDGGQDAAHGQEETASADRAQSRA